MTRDEFTDQLWGISQSTGIWAVKKLNQKSQTAQWWHMPKFGGWRLAASGAIQLDCVCRIWPDHLQEFRFWTQNTVCTAGIIVALSKLKTPWHVSTEQRLGQEYIKLFWIYGDQENTWMALQDGDLVKFLDSWIEK